MEIDKKTYYLKKSKNYDIIYIENRKGVIMKYLVTITETNQKTVIVESDNPDNAKLYVDNLYSVGELEMTVDDWVDGYIDVEVADPEDEKYYEVIKL